MIVEPTTPLRMAVLISGGGSNLGALLAACESESYGAGVVLVVSDRDGAGGLALASEAGVDVAVHRVADYDSRDAWDVGLADLLTGAKVDLVVSAGFLKILGPAVLSAFPGRIINTHNSLLPSFPGINGPRDALEAGVRITGATLFVVDPGMDTGPIIAQVAVPVLDDDDEESLLERIKVAERDQLVTHVGQMARGGWEINGRRARPLGAGAAVPVAPPFRS